MAHLKEEVYLPNPENQKIYEKLYQEYVILHDYFGRGENDVMKRLKTIKAEAKELGYAGTIKRTIGGICI